MNYCDDLERYVRHSIETENCQKFEETIVHAIAYHMQKGEVEDAVEWLHEYYIRKFVTKHTEG